VAVGWEGTGERQAEGGGEGEDGGREGVCGGWGGEEREREKKKPKVRAKAADEIIGLGQEKEIDDGALSHCFLVHVPVSGMCVCVRARARE
jgi:hypothetical protein